MPSTFTHAFAGAAIATLAPAQFRDAKLAAVLAAAAAAPDLDVIAFRFDIPYAHPLGHRGLSHSIAFALVVALAVWCWRARGAGLLSPASAGLFFVVWLACLSHGLLDAFTDGGLGVGFFVPFRDARYFFPWRPILTSPISISEFVSGRGLAVLRSEIGWVWLPITIVLGAVALVRRASRAGTSDQRPRRT
jgi:inner membrane protein